ncbi:EamA family transporter [Desulfovibrio sp. Huiquan2017]|uniref:DMT family transporter n=1 Tax=Desulfovibrio sp. Huiquan2017 TaxID=2816861 RepID=UPI001A92E4FA|nr:EamA family transporter [Desulfovibrio sp. Huiquan2017]
MLRKSIYTCGPVLILTGALCFSTTGFASALAVADGASVLAVGAVRMLIGGAALAAWCAWRGVLPHRKGWSPGDLLAPTLALAAYQLLFFKGTDMAGVALGTVMSIGVSPVAVAILNWVVNAEKPARAWYPATAVAILGLVLLNWTDAPTERLRSLLPSIGAGVAYAVYLVYSKPLLRFAPEAGIMLVCLLCGLCLSPFLFLSPMRWLASGRGIAVALDLGVVTAALAFTLVLGGLRTTPAPTAATLGLAEPLCAALLGFFCLHEAVTPLAVAGIACLMGGALLLSLWSPPCNSFNNQSKIKNRT